MVLERQSWSLAIKSFQLNQKYEGINKNSKDSGTQTFLKITFLCACSRQLQPYPSTSHKQEILTLLRAPCSAIATVLTSSLLLEFQKSILVFQALTTLNKGKLRKQHRLMSPENREHIYLLISLVWQEHSLVCGGWYQGSSTIFINWRARQ